MFYKMWDWTYKSTCEFCKMNLAQIGLEHVSLLPISQNINICHIPSVRWIFKVLIYYLLHIKHFLCAMRHSSQTSSDLNLVILPWVKHYCYVYFTKKENWGAGVIKLPEVTLIHGRAGMEVWSIWLLGNYALQLGGRENQSHLEWPLIGDYLELTGREEILCSAGEEDGHFGAGIFSSGHLIHTLGCTYSL